MFDVTCTCLPPGSCCWYTEFLALNKTVTILRNYLSRVQMVLECDPKSYLPDCSHFQMVLEDPSHSFQCLACKSHQLIPDIPSLQLHFATEHGVPNLLSTRATRTVVPPANFSCHAVSCSNYGEFYASCLFCGASGLQEEDMKLHLESRHGELFKQDWKEYCSQHCRWGSFVWTGITLVIKVH